MNTINYNQLSKVVSHALRHEPELYNLKLDPNGWVLLSELVTTLNSQGVKVDENHIYKMIELSENKRHQVLDGKIRAYYGHSISDKIIKDPTEPPERLYHGTISSNLKSIIEKGLLPMERQYVHLSIDKESAAIVGGRREGEIIIIIVNSKEASLGKVKFYKEENGIWLSDPIPPIFLTF